MPITITEPSPTGVVGPGLTVRATTTFPAPLGPDDHWFLSLVDPEDTNTIVGHARKQFTTQTVEIVMGTTDGVVHADEVQHPKVADGEPVRLIVELINGVDGHVMDSGQAVYTHDRRTGVIGMIQGSTQATAGFSDSDRLALMRINAWVWLDLVEEFLPEIVDWVGDRVRGKPFRQLVDPDRALEGEILPPPLQPFFGWVGLAWEIVQYPPGWGLDEGNPDLIELDYMQVVLMRELADGTFAALDGFYTRQVQQSIVWGTSVPSKVQYYVMPGGLVRFWWLVQLLPERQIAAALPNPH